MSCACLLYGDQEHYLDHLAPICALLDIPLIVTEDRIQLLAAHYYPDIEIKVVEPLALPQKILSSYDVIFSCIPKKLLDQLFLITELLYRKKLKTVWVPHGNSDKGHHSYFMENLRDEKNLIVYGQKMLDFFKQKGVFEEPKTVLVLGNYRKEYFERHRVFYETVLKKEITPFLGKKETLLYAPTWNDYEQNSSLSVLPQVLTLSEDFNLIIKLHPNQIKQNTDLQNDHSALFLESFPPIYPLLSIVDLYLGDYSSIGYDFLSRDKELYFLNHKQRDNSDPSSFLFRCGVPIPSEKFSSLGQVIRENRQETHSLIRKEIKRYTFEDIGGWEEARQSLMHYVNQLYNGAHVKN